MFKFRMSTAISTGRPIQARIRASALQHNLQVVRQHAPNSRFWAVVKANAYGHGLGRLLSALVAQGRGADGLALLEFDAAEMLRDARVSLPLLMLEGFFCTGELETCARLDLTAVVHAEEQLRMLESARLPAPVDVYFKLNTGMNRLGFDEAQASRAFSRLANCRQVRGITVMTHFADADGPKGVSGQLACFDRVLAAMPGAERLPRSLANSAAILGYPETHAEWVRPGIMIYGCTPFSDKASPEEARSAVRLGLEPVMTLTSRIIAVHPLAAGESVGYGSTFTATRPTRVGVVAVGYGDGYPRHAPGTNERGTPILVNGVRTRTIGRVSMDMIFADMTDLPSAGVGSEVTLWGDGLSADEVALAAGTVSYELLCALAARVPVDVVP
jgi:alanine racemase